MWSRLLTVEQRGRFSLYYNVAGGDWSRSNLPPEQICKKSKSFLSCVSHLWHWFVSFPPGCVCPSAPAAFSVTTGSAARSARRCARPVSVVVATSAPHAGAASTSTRDPTRVWPTAVTASTSTTVRFHCRLHWLYTMHQLWSKWVHVIAQHAVVRN